MDLDNHNLDFSWADKNRQFYLNIPHHFGLTRKELSDSKVTYDDAIGYYNLGGHCNTNLMLTSVQKFVWCYCSTYKQKYDYATELDLHRNEINGSLARLGGNSWKVANSISLACERYGYYYYRLKQVMEVSYELHKRHMAEVFAELRAYLYRPDNYITKNYRVRLGLA